MPLDVLKGQLLKSEQEFERLTKLGEVEKAYHVLQRVLDIKEQLTDKENAIKLVELKEVYATKEKELLLKQEKAQKQLLEKNKSALSHILFKHRTMELQLKSLQLQLGPHFIFNTLQSIQSYVFEQEPIITSDYLGKFAALMRDILSSSRQDEVLVKKELRLIRNYMELEQIRFKHSFSFDIKVDEAIDLDQEMMPPLLLQPIIENAIIHGFSDRTNGLIQIFFREQKNYLAVHIYDNGIGRSAAASVAKMTQFASTSALELLKVKQELSPRSGFFKFRFRIGDRKTKGIKNGTYVILLIENIKY